MWCARDRQSLLKALHSIPPQDCSQDEGMARLTAPGYRHLQGNSLGSATHLATHPSCLPYQTHQERKPHLVLEVPAVVLARVPSRPQSPTSSGVLLNEDPFVCYVIPITDLSHLHTKGWNIPASAPSRLPVDCLSRGGVGGVPQTGSTRTLKYGVHRDIMRPPSRSHHPT